MLLVEVSVAIVWASSRPVSVDSAPHFCRPSTVDIAVHTLPSHEPTSTSCLIQHTKETFHPTFIHNEHFIQHSFTRNISSNIHTQETFHPTHIHKKHAQTTLYALIYAAWCGSSCNEHANKHSAHKNATKDRHKSSRLQWELVIIDDNDHHQSLTHNTHVTLTTNLTYP